MRDEIGQRCQLRSRQRVATVLAEQLRVDLSLARIDADGGASDEGPELQRNITLEQYAEISVERDAILGKHGGSVGSALGAALGGEGGWAPEMEALLGRYGLRLADCPGGHVREWNARIQSDRRVQEAFLELSNRARLKAQGVDPNSHEGRVAGMIRSGNLDVEGAKVNARAAAQQMAEGQGGDPDPVVFPGQKLERLSHYVGLMKGMQTGDMMGALKCAGLDMGAYVQVAQAWGVKLASDPVLGAKFGEMMAK